MSINVCKDPNSKATPSSQEITACNPESREKPNEIRVCEEAQTCDDLPAVTLTGQVDTDVGASYEASGGKPPYIYDISCGQLDQDGTSATITDITDCCPTMMLSVVDACGNRAEMLLRHPEGQWVNTDTTNHCSGADFACDETVISGATKTVYTWEAVYCGQLNDLSVAGCTNEYQFDEDCTLSLPCTERSDFSAIAITWTTEYEWQCL